MPKSSVEVGGITEKSASTVPLDVTLNEMLLLEPEERPIHWRNLFPEYGFAVQAKVVL